MFHEIVSAPAASPTKYCLIENVIPQGSPVVPAIISSCSPLPPHFQATSHGHCLLYSGKNSMIHIVWSSAFSDFIFWLSEYRLLTLILGPIWAFVVPFLSVHVLPHWSAPALACSVHCEYLSLQLMLDAGQRYFPAAPCSIWQIHLKTSIRCMPLFDGNINARCMSAEIPENKY